MALTLFEILYITGDAAYLLLLLRARRMERQGGPVETDRPWMENLLNFAGFFGLQVLPVAAILTPWLNFASLTRVAALGWLGAGLFAAALWLIWRAHADLGASWSGVVGAKPDHALVTCGVYAWVRHPIYAGLLLWAAAQALLVPNWIVALAGFAGLLPNLVWRIPREEAALERRYGEAYARYARRTGRVWPRFGARRGKAMDGSQ